MDLSGKYDVSNIFYLHQSPRATHCNPKWLHFLSTHLCSTWREKRNINKLNNRYLIFSHYKPISQITRNFLRLLITNCHTIVTFIHFFTPYIQLWSFQKFTTRFEIIILLAFKEFGDTSRQYTTYNNLLYEILDMVRRY